MTENKKISNAEWDDDEPFEWTPEIFDIAQISIGGKVIREATGVIGKRGRPKLFAPKRQVTLRLDQAVIDGFRAMGPRWQSRINAELRKVLGV